MDQQRFCGTCYFCIHLKEAHFCGEGPPRLIMGKSAMGQPVMRSNYPPVDLDLIACGKYRPDIKTSQN